MARAQRTPRNAFLKKAEMEAWRCASSQEHVSWDWTNA